MLTDAEQGPQTVTDKAQSELATVGVHRTPQQLGQEALSIGHPAEANALFPSCVEGVIDEAVSTSHQSLAQSRTEKLRRWAFFAEDYLQTETEVKAPMSARRREVLQNKRLTFFSRLIEDFGHQDLTLFENFSNGVSLTGELPKSGVFKNFLCPAKISCDNLRKLGKIGKESILKTVSSSGDAALDSSLWEATIKEVKKGFLEGPIQVEDLLGDASLTKRIPVQQKNKVRPLDDYKANMVNRSVTQTEGATVQTIDHVAAMVGYWLKVSRSKHGRFDLCAKRCGLSDAYKQIHLSDEAYEIDAS